MSRTRRRQLLMGPLCGGLLCLVDASGASAQSTGAAALEIVNRASVSIVDVRLASSAMSAWGSNLLATPVGPSQQRRVAPERQEGCLYAIRIVYQDNRFERFGVIDLCRNNEFVFAAKTAQAIANQSVYSAPPAYDVSIANRSSVTIRAIRMSPANDRMWGANRLGSKTLAPNQPFSVPLDKDRGCLFRVYAFYEDSMVEVVPSANLCDDHNVVFRRTAALTYDQLPANMRVTPTNVLLLSNQSGFQIDWIYVFSANDRGRDRLANNEVLPSGRQKRVDVSDQSQCYVTVLAVYQDRREERLQNFDLCAAHEPIVTMRMPSGSSNPQGGSQGVPSRP